MEPRAFTHVRALTPPHTYIHHTFSLLHIHTHHTPNTYNTHVSYILIHTHTTLPHTHTHTIPPPHKHLSYIPHTLTQTYHTHLPHSHMTYTLTLRHHTYPTLSQIYTHTTPTHAHTLPHPYLLVDSVPLHSAISPVSFSWHQPLSSLGS